MFFRLTNLQVTFHTIMNNLLRDMIEVGDILALINDIIVEMEIEEGYDNIIKEVLKGMVENDLFVKLEKYMWKVREVEFLEVIMEPDSVKIEKEKVQGAVDWPVPRSVKDM